MNEREIIRAKTIINNLVKQHKSMRELARKIDEDVSDISRWRSGRGKIKTRAVVELARLYGIKPHELRPDWFPADLEFIFNNKEKKYD